MYHIYIVVWGKRYVNTLRDFTLPTILSQNNLPALAQKDKVELYIATSQEDQSVIDSFTLIDEIKNFAEVKYEILNFETIPGDKYTRMTEAHKLFCLKGKQAGAYGLFLSPDMLLSNGAFIYFDSILTKGYQAIMMIGPRIIEEKINTLRGNTRNISAREIVSLCFKHKQAETISFIITNNIISNDFGFIIWPISDYAWIVHPLYALPIAVNMSNSDPNTIGRAIEMGDFVKAIVDNCTNRIHVVKDSDNAMIAGLTLKDEITQLPIMSTTFNDLKNRLSRASDYHKYYFGKQIIIHSEDIIDISIYSKPVQDLVESLLK
jgi:hypothetical protein